MAPLVAIVAQQAVNEGTRWWEPNPWMGWLVVAGLGIGVAWGLWDTWRGN